MHKRRTEVEEEIEVLFRKSAAVTDPEAHYPGFNQECRVLRQGSVLRKGGSPLPCDIECSRDVAVPMRDGILIYVDIYRPTGDAEVPAIVAWTPFSKAGGYHTLDLYPGRFDIPESALSGLQTWEGPDPAYWCDHGYAVVNADARGAFMSQGDIHFWGSQEGEDGYDLVEWLAAQDWCNGRVGLTGNSWLAIVQWHVAAQRPPHLAAIAPWEGSADLYRHGDFRGGMPDTAFCEFILRHLYGNNRSEDVVAMIEKYPLMNAYWEDKAARLDKIDIPAYVVASYTNPLHTEGTFHAYEGLGSTRKWLRVHNSVEWPDYYRNVDDLRRFFDRYLKNVENGWEQTPKVRLCVLDPGGKDEVDRRENEFPLARTEYRKLFLDAASGRFLESAPDEVSTFCYRSDDEKEKAVFTIGFDNDVTLLGHASLRLWVEANGNEDMDLFVRVQKLDKKGKVLDHLPVSASTIEKVAARAMKTVGLIRRVGFLFYSGPTGRLRVSRRRLDERFSTPSRPCLAYDVEEALEPGQIVLVHVPIAPMGMKWHRGEQLRLVVAGHDLVGSVVPGTRHVPTINKGEHIIYTGGKYDSYLLVPVVA
jgi:predicted acyl esterase